MNKLRRLLLVPLAIVLAASCSDDRITSVAQRDLLMWSARGFALPKHAMDERAANLARSVALALADSAVRTSVYQALHSSPIREHKLHLQPFLNRIGARLGSGIAAAMGAGTTRAHVVASMDSLVDVEFYMPVKAHFAAWSGDDNLIVATHVYKKDTPVGYDLRGRAVELSLERAPTTPTLVIVPSEYRWHVSQPSLDEVPTCPPEQTDPCGDGNGWSGGGGSGGSGGGGIVSGTFNGSATNPVPDSSWGFTQIFIDSLARGDSQEVVTETSFESWPEGEPDFEVTVLMGDYHDYTNPSAAPWHCASADYISDPIPSVYRYWDDNKTGELYERNVMLLSGTQITNESYGFSGQPRHWLDVPIYVLVSEDDGASCSGGNYPDQGFLLNSDDFVGDLLLPVAATGVPVPASGLPNGGFARPTNQRSIAGDQPNYVKYITFSTFTR